MNLIDDIWLPVIRADGTQDRIAPWQIVEIDNPVLDILAPRPDFRGALYQFLIGLLQTAFAPEDHDEWMEYWDNMPDADMLKNHFHDLAPAFEFDNSKGPAFMQDFALDKPEQKPISGLLIEAPGEKTQKDNLDFFIKRKFVNRLCLSCAASALLTMQMNAPSGGAGHRVSLRGGGPLTSLVLPVSKTHLWNGLWLNVMNRERFGPVKKELDASVFPWLGPTRTSEKKGSEIRPEDVHPLQMFWAMPRRIRIDFKPNEGFPCDLCGYEGFFVSESFRTKNYGMNYSGEWTHVLTPYRFDIKKEKSPISIKGNQGGLGYRHWLGLVMSNPSDGCTAAEIVKLYLDERAYDIGESDTTNLWCFGYDMDNMKARCWYDHSFPLFCLDTRQRENVLAWTTELINAAQETTILLRSQVKSAWFRRPSDVKGDMNGIVMEFWQRSEPRFYEYLEKLTTLPGDQGLAPPEIYSGWAKTIRNLAFELFDSWVMEAPAEDLDMRRIVAAREELRKKLYSAKPLKILDDRGKSGKEA